MGLGSRGSQQMYSNGNDSSHSWHGWEKWQMAQKVSTVGFICQAKINGLTP